MYEHAQLIVLLLEPVGFGSAGCELRELRIGMTEGEMSRQPVQH